MAVKPHAGAVGFALWNASRELATPPLVFPGVNQSNSFSYSYWVRPLNTIPTAGVSTHTGFDGSFVDIAHNGQQWIIWARQGSVQIATQAFANVQIDRWMLICVSWTPPYFNMYVGFEDPTVPQPWLNEVKLTYSLAYQAETLNFDFNYFQLITHASLPICNFKFWNSALTLAQFEKQAQRWDTSTDSFGPAPFWASPLRTPGDLASIANPYASPNWEHGHAFSRIDFPGNLEMYADPQYMANHYPTPTWVYPNKFTQITIDPGLTPVIPTFYKGVDFFDFADKGSVPELDFQIQSIIYYAATFGGLDPGIVFNEAWGLYKDENGVEVSNTTDTQYRINPGTTGVTIPGPIKASNMYLWKFGGQFKWVPVTPQQATNTAFMGYLLLYVTYLGYPTGIPKLPAQDMAGLFAINRGGPSIDQYNRGVVKKIPDPTIRTAYIGE